MNEELWNLSTCLKIASSVSVKTFSRKVSKKYWHMKRARLIIQKETLKQFCNVIVNNYLNSFRDSIWLV